MNRPEIDMSHLPLNRLDQLRTVSYCDDGRMFIGDLYRKLELLKTAGWQSEEIYSQKIALPHGPQIDVPVFAYKSRPGKVQRLVLAGIHGREPAGPNALAAYVKELIEIGKNQGILVISPCNPHGYVFNKRFAPSGNSVGDSDHFFISNALPTCEEADRLTAYLKEQVLPGVTAVLDLHEDPSFEDIDQNHSDSHGTYVYVAGEKAAYHPITMQIVQLLHDNGSPLLPGGHTRYGEMIINGMVVDTQDRSIDEYLAKILGATPVITPEIFLHTPTDPPLAERVKLYQKTLDIFFGR